LQTRNIPAVFTTKPTERVLDNGLKLKCITGSDDAERLIAFNASIFGAGVGAMTRSLLFHHPATKPEYCLYIEAEGQIVSSLALIPWEWRYDEVTLKSAEMGIVGTREDFRNRGLIRLLDARFKELLRADGFHLSHIQGIPYFYRQFGYEYALPLEEHWRAELHMLLTQPDPGICFRPATVEDIPTLMQFYEAEARQLDISAVRTADTWRYLLKQAAGTATESEIWLLETDGQPVAYCRIPREGFGDGLIVDEVSRVDPLTANTLLGWLKSLAVERGKPYIRFNLPETNDLLRAARSSGVYRAGGYQWQIHVVDAARLLRQLSPVLERRLADSLFANLTQTVFINLYRSGIELHFEAGKLRAVNASAKPVRSEINIPPNLLAPLVLGYHSRHELAAFYPDLGIYGQSGLLIDTLFPKMNSFIHANY
jgi:predicted N-acetyltransferase YhbS